MNWRSQIDWVRQQRDDDIVAMRREGASMRAIGERFGLTHVRILYILRERGEAPPPKDQRFALGNQGHLAALAAAHPERLTP